MAYIWKFGKPDLFITFSANPKWKEITDKNLSTVSGYGEIISSHIINEIFNHNGIKSEHKDSRLFIKTKL